MQKTSKYDHFLSVYKSANKHLPPLAISVHMWQLLLSS